MWAPAYDGGLVAVHGLPLGTQLPHPRLTQTASHDVECLQEDHQSCRTGSAFEVEEASEARSAWPSSPAGQSCRPVGRQAAGAPTFVRDCLRFLEKGGFPLRVARGKGHGEGPHVVGDGDGYAAAGGRERGRSVARAMAASGST